MPEGNRPLPEARKPLDQSELVHRLDHAVFGVDEESGLLHHMRVVESKMDRLTGAIVIAALSVTVSIVAATVTFALSQAG